jgi:hypothetical protein
VGEVVRWHLTALGSELDLHTAHWHGNMVRGRERPDDVVMLLPGAMKDYDMVPWLAGKWMLHCHVRRRRDSAACRAPLHAAVALAVPPRSAAHRRSRRVACVHACVRPLRFADAL